VFSPHVTDECRHLWQVMQRDSERRQPKDT